MDKKELQKNIFRISQKVKKTIFDFGLIEDGDKILIGLSGGKDSLALTEILSAQQKIFSPRFSLVVAHINLTNIPYESDIDYLRSFCQQQGVEFEEVNMSFSSSGIEKKDEKTPCFFCSWSRRKALFETAKKLNCNKIALGHHQDDILETFFLNMLFQGNIGTMPPKLKMNKFDMTIIRPLCLLKEDDLKLMSKIRKYKKQVKKCPFEKETKRNDIKKLLKTFDNISPIARKNIWRSMMNVQDEYLPKKINNDK